MSQFIETIRVEYGKLMALTYHQCRVNNTLTHFGVNPYIVLSQLICPSEFSHFPVIKCKIVYDLDEINSVEFIPYAIKSIATISMMNCDGKDYSFKYADRSWINDLVNFSGTDEIIICDQQIIKDASYANLAFYNGHEWHTPAQPLLKGTRREQLVKERRIVPKNISINQLHLYTQVKFINAMMTWEEAPLLDIKNLSL